MYIKSIKPVGGSHDYQITLEDGTEWTLDFLDGGDLDPWWEVRLNIGTADNHDELMEQGKAMMAFSRVAQAIDIVLPDLEWESEDDDHELMYYTSIDSGDLIELVSKI